MASSGTEGTKWLQRRPSLPLTAAIAGVAVLASVGAIVNAAGIDADGGPNPVVQSALLDWIILSFTFSGLIAWRRRPESRFGPLMIAGGLATVVSSVSSVDTTLTQTIGQAFDLVPFAVFLHIFLAFPSGELRSRGERTLVAATYIVSVGLQLLILVLSGFDPNNSFALIDAPELAADIYRWQLTLLAALLLGGIAVLITRRIHAGRPARPLVALLINSFSLALVMSAAVLLMGAWDVESPLFLPIQRATFVVVGLSAIVFLLVLLDARLARASVGNLLIELRAEPPPDDLAAPIARALHDPTLELGYWLSGYESWADQDGRELKLPAGDDPDRSMTLIDREGEHLAVLVHDPSLDDEPELLHAVSAAAAFALENQRLQVELRAKLQELEGSRGRVIQAGQQERKRLERNLHDGAQQRLIALSLDLGRLEGSLDDDPEARERIEAARAEIAVSLEELRAVARGLHPAVLSGHGLAVALQSLVSSAPVPVALEVDVGERLEESVEVAAYYVVNESLANIGKHAEAASARVVVTRVGQRARGRDHRRRRRRRRHREGLRPARAGRPGRGAGRAPSHLDPQRRGNPGQGGDAVRVAIAEDSVLLREGLARLLEDNGFEVVAQCEDADSLLRKLTSHELDVVILDIRLPPTHTDEGLRAAIRIREEHPEIAVLVLSQYVEPGLAMKLLADSAERTGYLLKDRISDVSEFLDALRRVANGGSAIDPQIVSTLLSRQRSDDPLEALTPREREVLEKMATGTSNQGIADDLVISIGAVEKHVSSLFGKLGLPSTGTESRRVLAVLLFLNS